MMEVQHTQQRRWTRVGTIVLVLVTAVNGFMTSHTVTKISARTVPNTLHSSRQYVSSLNSPSDKVFPRKYSSQYTSTLSMSVEGDFDPDALSKAKEEVEAGSIKARLRALYKFTRPHTIRGTILGSIAGTIRALADTPGAIASARWSVMLPRAFLGMIALLLGNAFIVGINQIYDEGIDKLNKPFLPVASGEMSKRAAWLTCAISATVGPLVV